MNKSELFYEEESKTARPHKYSINYKDKNDSVYAIKFYSMQKQIDEKDKEIERLNNIIKMAISAINIYQDSKKFSIGYENLKKIRGILRGNDFDIQMFEEYLKELKKSGNNE